MTMPQDQAGDASAIALACTLPAPDLAGRRITLRTLLADATAMFDEPDGVRMTFRGDDPVAAALLAFVLAERHCCRAFTYTLRFAPDHSAIAFTVQARDGGIAALKALYLAEWAAAGLAPGGPR